MCKEIEINSSKHQWTLNKNTQSERQSTNVRKNEIDELTNQLGGLWSGRFGLWPINGINTRDLVKILLWPWFNSVFCMSLLVIAVTFPN